MDLVQYAESELARIPKDEKGMQDLVSRTFHSIGINATGFPEKRTVAMKDGKEAVYKFIGKKG